MNIYTPNEFCKKVGVTYQTLIKWEKKGKLTADRNADNRRYYTDRHLEQCIGQNIRHEETDKRILFRRMI